MQERSITTKPPQCKREVLPPNLHKCLSYPDTLLTFMYLLCRALRQWTSLSCHFFFLFCHIMTIIKKNKKLITLSIVSLKSEFELCKNLQNHGKLKAKLPWTFLWTLYRIIPQQFPICCRTFNMHKPAAQGSSIFLLISKELDTKSAIPFLKD